MRNFIFNFKFATIFITVKNFENQRETLRMYRTDLFKHMTIKNK